MEVHWDKVEEEYCWTMTRATRWSCCGRSYIGVVDCVFAVFSLMYRPMYLFGHMCTQLVRPDGRERNWSSSRVASLFGRYPFWIPSSIPSLLLGHFQQASARHNIWLSYILRPSPKPEMSQVICGIKYINVGRKWQFQTPFREYFSEFYLCQGWKIFR